MSSLNYLKAVLRRSLRLKNWSGAQLVIISFCLLLFSWSVQLINTHYNGYFLEYTGHTQYHTDDVPQANIIHSWQNGNRDGAIVGDDNWIIKYPIYLLTNNLNIEPTKRLFLNSFITLAITALVLVIGFYILAKTYLKDRTKQVLSVLTATLLTGSLSEVAFGIIKIPNSRNIEIAVFILILAIIAGYERNTLTINRKSCFGLVLLAALVMANDPMFVFIGAVPIAAICLLFWFFGKNSLKINKIFFATLLSLPLYLIVKKIIIFVLPMELYHHRPRLESYEGIVAKMDYLVAEASKLLSLDIFKREIYSLSTLKVILSFALVLMIIGSVIHYLRHEKIYFSPIKEAGIIVFVIILWSVAAISNSSTQSARYLIVVPFLLYSLSIFLYKVLPLRRQVYSIFSLVVAIWLISLFANVRAIAQGNHQVPNAANYQVINAIEEKGLKKGYAEFWAAPINTYLSNQSINFVPITCENEVNNPKVGIMNILMEASAFSKPADRTFILYTPEMKALSLCSLENLKQQFGEIDERVAIENTRYELLIYDRDIAKQMPIYKLEELQ